ncbi:23S rRNA (cytidine(2498)-2'-O)-methyltransferase RlmM [Alteromonas sp. CYL-A6]|uniref:23S rRNA (cytidine(2498)-2'-O)-methyltransferase RlmM n=1 Tax=Alteromonas nitratireducens TaxID=3390813 RepID=UPI0034AEDEA0
MSGLLAYCRAGYENDTANELSTLTAEQQVFGYPESVPGQGYVMFHLYDEAQAGTVAKWPVSDTIFSRQLVVVLTTLNNLDRQDRITPVVEALQDIAPADKAGDVVVEYPDTEAGKALAKFCRKFVVPLRQSLRKAGLLTTKPDEKRRRLHVFFSDFDTCIVGYSHPRCASPFPMGICRLKFPSDAPSRSTLKLEEALLTMLDDDSRARVCRAGARAVDLGACPGGWTYQLVQRGMFVEAVDNGAIDDALMQTGQVAHFSHDGFTYRPQQGHVDLLVCDMIEQPDRVATLMGDWLCKRWTEHAIFNLKLPMKRRYETVTTALTTLTQRLSALSDVFTVSARHLYHDRDEVTVCVIRR